MNHDFMGLGNVGNAGNVEKKPEKPKKAYNRRDKKPLNFADVCALIEAKTQEIRNIQHEIDGLTTKRNELFFLESQEMGIVNVMQDPDSASRLADLIKESAHQQY